MTPSQQYVTISRRALDVEDYIDIVRRHTSWILGPLFAGLVTSCVIAFLLPNTYVSKAVMRISPSQISEALVPSTVTQQMNERIAQMQQEILSRNSLSELIQRPALNLYRRERDSQPLEDVIEQMRARDIRVSIVNLAGQGNRPASAFQIEFAYPDRFKAQAVVQALITKFTESMSIVTNQVGKTTLEFMNEEIRLAKVDLDRLDTELTNFRIQNAGHLPEELQVNLQTVNNLQQQMAGLNESLSRIAEEKLTLETNLQTMKMQRDTYNSMVAAQEPGSAAKIQNERLAQLNREIVDYESQLLQLREMYTDTYPNIRNAKAQLALKKKERDELQLKEEQEALKPKQVVKKTTNPMIQERLNEIQGSIDMVNTQLRNKETERLQRLKQLDDVNKSLTTFNGRISQVPANQQRYVALNREHELASQHYLDLQRRETAANTYENVNKRKAGENLEVLDNASLPEAPTAPNRMLITGIGVGVGLMAGIFLSGVKEMKDTSLKNLKDVRAYTNLPILSSIPLLENDLLVRRKRRLAYVGWSASIILGIVAMSGSMYYHYFLLSS